MSDAWDSPQATWQFVEFLVRARNRATTAAVRPSMGSVGARTTLQWPVKLHGGSQIFLGRDVQIGPDCWLQVLEPRGRLQIGDGVRITGRFFASAVQEIVIEPDALIAHNVYIADHSHARADPNRAIRFQGVTDVSPVRVGAGSWLGYGVVVLPGVTIGRGAIVGANSVVRGSIPDRTIAAGAPARVVATLPGAIAEPTGA